MSNQSYKDFIKEIPTENTKFQNKLSEYKEKITKENDLDKISSLLKELDKFTHFYELKKEKISNLEDRYNDYCSMEDKLKTINSEDLDKKITTQQQYASKYTEQYGFRKYSKKGKLNTTEILQNINRQLNGIKVDKSKVKKVLNEIANKMYEYDYETSYINSNTYLAQQEQLQSFKLMKEIKEIIENNQAENEKDQDNLFSSTNLAKSSKTNTIIRNVFFDEEQKYNKDIVEDFFTRTFDAIELFENPMENMDNEKFKELTKESGNIIAEELVNGMLNNFYVSGNNSSEILTNIEKMLGKFFNSQQAKNKNAEIISVYLNYFRYDFKSDYEKDKDNGPINKDGSLNQKYINEKIVKNSYIYTSEELKDEYDNKYVEEDISPMFKLENNKLVVINEAGAGSVDSFYYSRNEEKVVGTSTTVDTTGTIEKDQFIRHLSKTKELNDLVLTVEDKKDKNFVDIIEELKENSEEKWNKVVSIQGEDNQKTYERILEKYKDTLNENGQITPETIDKLFENNAYSFDMLGTVVKEENRVISSLNDIFLFIGYQNTQTPILAPYTLEAIEHFHTKSKTEVKNFMIYNDLKKSYNVEDFKDFKDNLEKTILDFLINSFDSLSDEDFKKLTNKDTSKEDRFTIYNSFLENNKDKTQQIEIVLKEITEKLVNQLSDNVKKDYVVENIKLETEIPSLMENFTLAMYQSNNKLDKMSTQYDKRFIKVNNLEERKLRQDFLKSVYYQHIVKNKEWFCLISKQSETIDTQSETIDTQSETIDTQSETIDTLEEEKERNKNKHELEKYLMESIDFLEDNLLKYLEIEEKERRGKKVRKIKRIKDGKINNVLDELFKSTEEEDREEIKKEEYSLIFEEYKKEKKLTYLKIKRNIKNGKREEVLKELQLEKNIENEIVLFIEEEIFFELLPKEKEDELREEMKEQGLDLPKIIVSKYFSKPEDENKIKEKIEKMRGKHLENLADLTEKELEKVIQEILKTENIDISKEETQELNKEITKQAKNTFLKK